MQKKRKSEFKFRNEFYYAIFFLIRNDAALRHEGHFKLKLKKESILCLCTSLRKQKRNCNGK